VLRGKLNPKIALFGHKLPKRDLDAVRAIYEKVEGRESRYELNLYVTGSDEDTETPEPKSEAGATDEAGAASAQGANGATVPIASGGAEESAGS